MLSPAKKGVVAQGFNLVTQALLQVATLPILVVTLGKAQAGLWLVLTALPAYLALSDLGLIGASATEMLKRVTRGDPVGARAVGSATWKASLLVFGLILLAGSALLVTTPLVEAVPGVDPTGADQARLVLIAQFAWVLLLQQTAILEACFRAAGSYPSGIVFVALARVAEVLALGAVLPLQGTMSAAAVTVLLVRLASVLTMRAVLRSWHPWIVPRIVKGDWKLLRPLVRPGLGNLAFPMSSALSVQAMVLVVARFLGAGAVVELQAIRVVSNLIRQVCNALNYGVMPRMTQYLAAGAFASARALAAKTLRLTIVLAAAAGIGITLFGPRLIAVWTGGAASPSQSLMLAMVISVLADLPLLFFSMVLLAVNDQAKFGAIYILGSALSVICACLLFQLPGFGLFAVPVGLLVVDLVATPTAVVRARRWLKPVGDQPQPLAAR